MKSKQSTQNCSYLLLVPIALRYSPFQAALYLLEVADLPSLSRPLPAGTQSEAQRGVGIWRSGDEGSSEDPCNWPKIDDQEGAVF